MNKKIHDSSSKLEDIENQKLFEFIEKSGGLVSCFKLLFCVHISKLSFLSIKNRPIQLL